MLQIDVEAWAYRLIRDAEIRRRVEDNRAELKSNWPEARDIARQLAGHANAAFGEPILWLFGVDEHSGVVEYVTRNMADWQPQLVSEFEGVAPGLRHFALRWKDRPFEALLFRTDAPPYVVKNPKRGKEGAGPFEYDVPWREGTTRSARRADLITMLRPVWKSPIFEPLGASVQLLSTRDVLVSGHLYVESPDLSRVLIRSASGSVNFGHVSIDLADIQPGPNGPDPDVVGTRSHLRVDGAGRIVFQGRGVAPALPAVTDHVVFTGHFRIAGLPRPVAVPISVPQVALDGSTTLAVAAWKLGLQ